VRSIPAGLVPQRLRQVLADGWQIRAASLEYVPEGGGGYHWKLTEEGGQPSFVTVDDLDDKDWMGQTRPAVLEGLGRALSTAAALRHVAGLDFVVAPVAPLAARGGDDLLRRLDDRFTVSVFPYLAGRSHPFGPYCDERLRDEALDMIAALHRSTPAVRDRAPRHVPSFTGRGDLDAFLLDPGVPWDGGPFSDPARDLLVPHTADVAELIRGFEHLVDLTAGARAHEVITHGEPHPANLMTVDGRLHLIDWDTTALAAPERDLSLIVTPRGDGVDRYQKATGREVEPAVITLYQVRWYLDDLASAIRLFRNRHRDTADTRRWWQGLAPRLTQLHRWLDLVG
jgi:spectinomycin phosphotransferase